MINKLYHGDCLEVMKDIPQVDCIITDPPYGINYKSSRQTYNPSDLTDVEYFTEIIGDDTLPVTWLELAYKVLKDDKAIYIFCHWSKWGELSIEVTKVGFTIKNMIVLNKTNWGMGDLKGSYAPKHELILFATKGRHIMNVPPRIADVWEAKVIFSGSYHYHPNQKPLSWLKPAIQQSTIEGDIILDPYAGSGSLGIACMNTKRNYILIEKDKHYYNVCKDRIKFKDVKLVDRLKEYFS